MAMSEVTRIRLVRSAGWGHAGRRGEVRSSGITPQERSSLAPHFAGPGRTFIAGRVLTRPTRPVAAGGDRPGATLPHVTWSLAGGTPLKGNHEMARGLSRKLLVSAVAVSATADTNSLRE